VTHHSPVVTVLSQAGTDKFDACEEDKMMLAEMVDHVIGIDPDRDWITAAVLDADTAGVVATGRFAADAAGYRDAVLWADEYSVDTERAWAIEGSASYGRGLTAALGGCGEWVIEFDRAIEKPSKDGSKTDELDAIRAGRETLGRAKLASPRAHQGIREALRVHTVARDSAVQARTAAINELKAFVVTAADSLRSDLRGLRTPGLVKHCAGFRHSTNRSVDQQCTRDAMRAVARRITHLNDEITNHEKALASLVDQAAPQLVAEVGIGPITAAAFYIAWSHPGRCRNETAFARLAGVAPISVNSGQTQDRHRLNRRGDRQLNKALHQVAVTKIRCDPQTQAYRTRRSSQGKTDREIRRCLKRYIARRVWRLLEHQTPPATTP
jgi:transposase